MAMAGSVRRLLAVFWLVFGTALLLHGQDAAADREHTLTPSVVGNSPPVFPRLVRAAGIIFSGRVTSVGRTGFEWVGYGQPGAAKTGPAKMGPVKTGAVKTAPIRTASAARADAGSTAVTFQVEHAIRGAVAGQRLTIYEWAGLWRNGERYRVGEQVLLFLYSPSRLGLTSPVAGIMGRFAMDSRGRVVMSALHMAMLGSDPVFAGQSWAGLAWDGQSWAGQSRAGQVFPEQSFGGEITRGVTSIPYADFEIAIRRSSEEP
jgi:hypothetical protein